MDIESIADLLGNENKKVKPMRMPSIDNGQKQDYNLNKTNSKLSVSITIDALRIIKEELFKLGIQLSDYKVVHNLRGFDLYDLGVYIRDIDPIRLRLPADDKVTRQESYDKPTILAFKVINRDVKARLNDELGLDYVAYMSSNDKVEISITAIPEEPESPEEYEEITSMGPEEGEGLEGLGDIEDFGEEEGGLDIEDMENEEEQEDEEAEEESEEPEEDEEEEPDMETLEL